MRRKRRKNPSGWAIAGMVLLGVMIIPPIAIMLMARKSINDAERKGEADRRRFMADMPNMNTTNWKPRL
jgi:hypothetical protein